MTREELVQELRLLPLREQEALVEEMLLNIQQGRNASDHSTEEKLAAIHRLAGAFKTNGIPPTDEELKQDYIDYLAKKYS
ncbi:MAG TPA: hypothetical protein VE969_07270 [Pyrinomonadaceae bacterium]|jgi:hypothetical protein|nr:hypothetical protein [Pyrinomonadaceae bacterium]